MLTFQCSHFWRPWSEAISDTGGNLHQVRACNQCNKIERRRIRMDLFAVSGLSPVAVNKALETVL